MYPAHEPSHCGQTQLSQATGPYPYGMTYPAAGYTHSVQLGLITDHMLRRLDEGRLLTISELMRRCYGQGNGAGWPQQQQFAQPVDYNGPPMLGAPGAGAGGGGGGWRDQIEHIRAQLYNVAGSERDFRRSLAEPTLGELSAADLDETEDSYKLILTFDKPRHSGWRRTSHGNTSSRHQRSSRPAIDYVRRHVANKVHDTVQYEKEPDAKQEPTVKPFKQFSAENDAQALRKAMRGVDFANPADEEAIIDILGRRSNAQRQDIIKQYKSMFGKDLVKDLKSELSGNFWKTVKALCLLPADYDASELRNAIKGAGTDDDCLIEIICTRTSRSLQMIKEAYKRRLFLKNQCPTNRLTNAHPHPVYNRSLEEDIISDTSGHYQRLLVSLLQANREQANLIDRESARKDAQLLNEAGARRWGTDESKFNSILVTRSMAQLRVVFHEYERLAGKTMAEAIEAEMSGDLAKGMAAIVKCVQNKAAYFAEALYKCMKGLGTGDEVLIRVIVTRCEVDMVQIKDKFQHDYKQPLTQFVADDTSGDYRTLLLTLLGESRK